MAKIHSTYNSEYFQGIQINPYVCEYQDFEGNAINFLRKNLQRAEEKQTYRPKEF